MPGFIILRVGTYAVKAVTDLRTGSLPGILKKLKERGTWNEVLEHPFVLNKS